MIYLERLRNDPLLLDAFESNVAEWVEGMEDPLPDLDGVSRSLLVRRDVELPDELRRYWAIAKRWKQVPILGSSNSATFENKPRFVSWGEDASMKAESMQSTKYLSQPENHFAMMISGSIANCRCCGWGLSRRVGEREWLLTDIDDKNLRETTAFNANKFLLEWGLHHLSHRWFDEEVPGEFSKIADEATIVWKKGERDFWFNPVGVYGWSYDYNGKREHRIAVQSQKKISEIVGRELTPARW